MIQKIQDVVPLVGNKNVFGLSSEQVRTALSKLMGPGHIAMIHLTYPAVDSINHKSRDTLVANLSGHGFSETADLVANDQPYLAFNDLQKALKVYHEIQRDSMAVGAALYYNGLTGIAAEEAILATLPKEVDVGLHLA